MQEAIECLRPYAAEPPADKPPEILPRDHDSPWGLDGAARRALAILLAGEEPGDRLYEMAEYLLTFCTEGYGERRHPDALPLNGAALALCGYRCAGLHADAEIWRLITRRACSGPSTGCRRCPTTGSSKGRGARWRWATDSATCGRP